MPGYSAASSWALLTFVVGSAEADVGGVILGFDMRGKPRLHFCVRCIFEQRRLSPQMSPRIAESRWKSQVAEPPLAVVASNSPRQMTRGSRIGHALQTGGGRRQASSARCSSGKRAEVRLSSASAEPGSARQLPRPSKAASLSAPDQSYGDNVVVGTSSDPMLGFSTSGAASQTRTARLNQATAPGGALLASALSTAEPAVWPRPQSEASVIVQPTSRSLCASPGCGARSSSSSCRCVPS